MNELCVKWKIFLYKKVVQILYNCQQRWHNPPFYAVLECPQKFDSGLRHLVKVLQTLVNRGLEAFFIFSEKLYKVVQPVNTRLTPISLPFARYLFLLHADRYNVAS